jgi:hypothetical protein
MCVKVYFIMSGTWQEVMSGSKVIKLHWRIIYCLNYTIFISIFHCEILLGLLSLYLMTELSKDILSWLSPKANSSSERGTLPGFLERKWKRVFRHPGAFPTQCTQIYTSSEQPNLMEIHTFWEYNLPYENLHNVRISLFPLLIFWY